MPSDKTFVRVTNREIYNEIKELHNKLEDMKIEITSRQDIANGKVKKAMWISSTAFTLSLILMGFLFQYIGKGGT